MEIPTDLVLAIVGGVITIIGSVTILLLKSLLDAFKTLTAKLELFGDNLSKVDLVVSKLLLVQAMCPNCPHPEIKVDTELLTKPTSAAKEE